MTGRSPSGAWSEGPRSSSTRPGWRRPTTSLAWSPWLTATTGDWCASGTRPSYRQSAEVACSPIGATVLPARHLGEVRRFAEPWQAEASLLLREGDPAAASLYAQHGRLRTVHPALMADRVARQHERQAAGGAIVAITTASTGTARAINIEIQRRRNPRQVGRSVDAGRRDESLRRGSGRHPP